jgi:hypothetical protein
MRKSIVKHNVSFSEEEAGVKDEKTKLLSIIPNCIDKNGK